MWPLFLIPNKSRILRICTLNNLKNFRTNFRLNLIKELRNIKNTVKIIWHTKVSKKKKKKLRKNHHRYRIVVHSMNSNVQNISSASSVYIISYESSFIAFEKAQKDRFAIINIYKFVSGYREQWAV